MTQKIIDFFLISTFWKKMHHQCCHQVMVNLMEMYDECMIFCSNLNQNIVTVSKNSVSDFTLPLRVVSSWLSDRPCPPAVGTYTWHQSCLCAAERKPPLWLCLNRTELRALSGSHSSSPSSSTSSSPHPLWVIDPLGQNIARPPPRPPCHPLLNLFLSLSRNAAPYFEKYLVM